MASLSWRFFTGSIGLFIIILLPVNLVTTAQSAARSVRIVERPDQQGTLNDLAKRYPQLAATLKALMAEARAKGSVKVTVKLAVPFAPQMLLTEGDKFLQYRDITSAVLAVRRALPMTKSFAARKWLPYIDLTLDASGLARLQTLPGLSRISRPEEVVWPQDVMAIASGKGFYSRSAASSALTTVSPRSTGRRDADSETAPYQVAIYYEIVPGQKSFLCSGALVAKRFVITSVACGLPNDPSEFSIAVSRHTDGSGQFYGVKRAYIHPKFAFGNFFFEPVNYDVAILELTTPVEGTTPATLASVSPARPGTVLQRSSFAFWEDEGTPLQQLNEVLAAPVNGLCGGLQLPQTVFCTKPAEGESLWGGEWTSLLTVEGSAGQKELVGLLSPSCVGEDCQNHYYTDLANPAVRSFITSLINAGDQRIGFRVTTKGVTEIGEDFAGWSWDPVTGAGTWLPMQRTKASIWVERASGEGMAIVRYRSKPVTDRPPEEMDWWEVAKEGYSGDADYMPLNRTLTFYPGETSKRIGLTIFDDNEPEPAEDFMVELFNPSRGWSIDEGARLMDVTIMRNDGFLYPDE